MTSHFQNIAVVGAGFSGAYVATLLGRLGRKVFLFDPKSPWEGSYGAGLLVDSLFREPVLDEFTEHFPVPSLKVFSPRGREFVWRGCQSVRICSRGDLTEFLLNRAREVGVTVVLAKIEAIGKKSGIWYIQTPEGTFQAGLLVGADGGAALIRKVLNLEPPTRRMTLEVSYSIPQKLGEEPVIRFLDHLQGSFWFSPRSHGSAAGLWASGRFLQARDLFDRLDQMLGQFLQIPVSKEATRSVAQISLFDKRDFTSLAGEDWALIGDAAGLVDPITTVSYGVHSASLFTLSCKGAAFSPSTYLEGLKKTLTPLLRKRDRMMRVLFRRPIMDWLVGRASTSDRLRRLLTSLLIAPEPSVFK